ncbi:MAG: DUF2764 family protein [Candidatus Omnitrophota bacterium]|nr:DUF2764 family protein [Candidatus Omnitrophota bacterium]
MPGYYTYLISSLPMLHFGMKPPFSFEKFLRICRGIIPGSDIHILETVSRAGEYACESAQPQAQPQAGDIPLAEKRWRTFDTALRNELVKIRAARKGLDPLKYIRRDGYADPSITHIAINVHRNLSILEAERTLDQERWRVLDELATGHYFDIDSLIVYAHKLLILERWESIRGVDKPRFC